MILDVEAADQILARQVHHESHKNKVEKNSPCAEREATAAAMLAPSNRTNTVGWRHISSAEVMIGKRRRQRGRGRTREGEGGNKRGG